MVRWLLILFLYSQGQASYGADKQSAVAKPDPFFIDEVWGKVGELSCLKCHSTTGEAKDSSFILRETVLLDGAKLQEAHSTNFKAFKKMARKRSGGQSRLLLKPVGELDHEGEQVLAKNSTDHRILKQFAAILDGGKEPNSAAAKYTPKPFFEGVTMLEPGNLLRRLTLTLAGRLPTVQEKQSVAQKGMTGLDTILDRLMNEDAFYTRLKEGFNDIFLTNGYEGNGELILSYNHFEKTRLWYQRHDLSHLKDKNVQQRARWALAADYRKAIREEPLELIAHVVRNNKPFTEIVTADYIMVTPYSARGYGIFETVKDRFKDANNPFEYVPARLPKLRARSKNPANGPPVQESKTGYYPHAGLLSTFQYLRRYPTTDTNRNRLRARMYYQHFLGVDVMALADQVSDAAAIDAQYKTPWMQAADCVVCHRTVDPVAGLFQDFYNEEGHFGPRPDGWFKDMFATGLEGKSLPKEDRWRALQWLGERTAEDPRFAIAMTEHVWYLLTGRKALRPPQDIEDPLFTPRRRAYQLQRREIAAVARQFRNQEFNLKVVFKELSKSPFYRANGLQTAAEHPHRRAELHDLGVVRLLAPEQLERKIEALFGKRWGKVNKELAILYGGIDSKSVTERLTQPSGAMGAIQRIMANDVACQHVTQDFFLPAAKRRLFSRIEKNIVPGRNSEDDLRIRKTIVHLHDYLLDKQQTTNDPDVDRTFKLFSAVIAEAAQRKDLDKRDTYHCGRVNDQRVDDRFYTLRAWRAVVTYLLRRQEFLYE